ncbi:MAG: FAD-dependent oxidoreductase [Gloeomargarita sp. SKYG116]|nr:FAD-dependent oxidoreductase [Gloeomargarita sp. SKYG116]MDW8401221.1 hypothetical protein [Gloeomargarita sp. SKYGB_i_bin116]
MPVIQELLYREIPCPAVERVRAWLQQWRAPELTVTPMPTGLHLRQGSGEWTVVTWGLQRTTYLKVFRWQAGPGERLWLRQLTADLDREFPLQYPVFPTIDLTRDDIFTALAPHYPATVHFFQKIPNGAYDLKRVYWWEQRWRQGVQNPQVNQVLFAGTVNARPDYDLIYVGGALGVIHAAVMARLGYRVLLIERLPFGRMNREWNISRSELQTLIDLNLFTAAEIERTIACEYEDGFHQFYWPEVPPKVRAPVLHTPTVLNIALDAQKLLQLAGEKLRRAGGDIWDEGEFIKADVGAQGVTVQFRCLRTGQIQQVTGRLLVDAMGTASPIAWQLNGGRAFDSVCPTVGAVLRGLDPQVWDRRYGDVLHSHGDISRGRQLIWELFPGARDELTVYLFHYHQPCPQNPGSLLELYEDFFHIFPEYRRCDLEQLQWVKATFGYIPGHFSSSFGERRVAWDRVISIGDAAALQSPLVFTGFGSLVRNLPRLTDLLDTALRHDLLDANSLNVIRAYQGNTSVTWLFSKGMMVPTGKQLPPAHINSILNTFFGLLAKAPPEVADRFIKDRSGWWEFTHMALKAAWTNPLILVWIWPLTEWQEMLRWLRSYVIFTWEALVSAVLLPWWPVVLRWGQPWLEKHFPKWWLLWLAQSYHLGYSVGRPRVERRLSVSS